MGSNQRRSQLRPWGGNLSRKPFQARSEAWDREQRRVNYAAASAMLTAWKKTDDLTFLNEVSSVPLQQALRHLQSAFASFIAKRARYPRFKCRKKSRASAEYSRSAFRWRDGRLSLAKMVEPLNIVLSRPLPEGAEPSTVTVSRDAAGRWFVSILVETSVEHLPATDNALGVDAGIESLATLSTGEKIANPRHERRDRKRLAKAQRDLHRKAKGSNNREKASLKVARIHARIADRRRDHLHKLTTRLVRENQTVVIEDLNVSGMLGNGKPARAISDASWSQFRSMLEYEAAWYGREVIAVDRWLPSSKTCSVCGQVADAMSLRVRSWVCTCGADHDRDVNAARNILAAGLAVAACGDGVRPARRKPERQLSAKQETQPARVGTYGLRACRGRQWIAAPS
ncbi:RNA-guided endonuclease InsQ/TnpB family protein [Saccharopolyspora erythraea]|uniref:RNA-guided endonuclease InsQ/TnpB family protein n=1 Tax=Saccharopolyspora erythraea TaxID=1836 RepID=UPI0024AFB6DD|nr:RNA-guided endonuclease TnpB family protein [Saccharopolyspora erythraea]